MRTLVVAVALALVGCAPPGETIRVDVSLEDGHAAQGHDA